MASDADDGTVGPSYLERAQLKANLAARLRRLRVDRYGEGGGHELARGLGLPKGTWLNYEEGTTIPGEVLLCLIVLTSVEPLWLLRGEQPMYRVPHRGGFFWASASDPEPSLERNRAEEVPLPPDEMA